MKWILGLDLRPRGEGAIQLASWLAGVSRGHEFFPVHVLEDEHMRAVLRLHHLDEVTAGARGAAQAALEPLVAAGARAEPEIVQAANAADALVEACRARGADGILIGRAGRREGGGMVRLGRVARGVLRALPRPVVVVPPDLTVADLGDGPVVALVQLAQESPVLDTAGALARAVARPLVAVHVVGGEEDGAYLPLATREATRRERLAEAEARLASWGAARGLGAGQAVAVSGRTLDRAVDVALERRAPLLVVGARRTSPAAALVAASLGRELAAVAPLPVAVIPPGP
jgi:nucleotide-binding universal stress UspA family protein